MNQPDVAELDKLN